MSSHMCLSIWETQEDRQQTLHPRVAQTQQQAARREKQCSVCSPVQWGMHRPTTFFFFFKCMAQHTGTNSSGQDSGQSDYLNLKDKGHIFNDKIAHILDEDGSLIEGRRRPL